jgi:hypothetical protein
LQLVEKAIEDTSGEIREYHTVNWNKMLELIHLTGMENAVKKQYQNATNIASRIRLHRESANFSLRISPNCFFIDQLYYIIS